jgi:hypothetical protein
MIITANNFLMVMTERLKRCTTRTDSIAEQRQKFPSGISNNTWHVMLLLKTFKLIRGKNGYSLLEYSLRYSRTEAILNINGVVVVQFSFLDCAKLQVFDTGKFVFTDISMILVLE